LKCVRQNKIDRPPDRCLCTFTIPSHSRLYLSDDAVVILSQHPEDIVFVPREIDPIDEDLLYELLEQLGCEFLDMLEDS